MKNVLKLVCLLGLIVLVIVTAFAFSALFQSSPTAKLPPVLSVGILLAVGCAVWGVCAAFTKRHTTATGFG